MHFITQESGEDRRGEGRKGMWFLKIVFEGFFFKLKILLQPLLGRSFIFEYWEDVQNGFKGEITHTVETPK